MLGASPAGSCAPHILPNALAPVIVVATIALGVFIAAEATLSFLGVGLTAAGHLLGHRDHQTPAGASASPPRPHMLLFPGVFLALTVLAFIMLGDAVRDAFDPKLR